MLLHVFFCTTESHTFHWFLVNEMNTGTTLVKSVSMHEKVFVTEAEAFLWPLHLILAHKRTPLIRKSKEISQLSQRSVIREKTCCSSKKQANGESKRKSITVLLLFSWSRKTNSISKTKNLKMIIINHLLLPRLQQVCTTQKSLRL